MQNKITKFFIFLIGYIVLTSALYGGVETFGQLYPSKKDKQKILNGRVLAYITMENTPKSTQQLDFKISGMHQKSCKFSLKRLSRYENFKNHVGFIKKSFYNEASQLVYFSFESSLLPFSMSLSFKIPRITKPGKYAYRFSNGILKDLTGFINVSEHKGRCFFHTTAKWKGKTTGINPTIFELFSKTLSKIAMETLFKISSKI